MRIKMSCIITLFLITTSVMNANLVPHFYEENYKVTRQLTKDAWGRTLFNSPWDLHFLNGRYLFAVDRTWSRIVYTDMNQFYDYPEEPWVYSHGKFGPELGSFKGPRGICYGSADTLYVADVGNNRIVKLFFHPSGDESYLHSISSFGSDCLLHPWDVKYHGGKIYVVDTENNRIVRFSRNGTFEASYGSYGSEAGQFNKPTSIDKYGNFVYVLDKGNKRVVILYEDPQQGNFELYSIEEIVGNEYMNLADLSIDTYGNLFITDINNCNILKFNPFLEETLWVYGSEGYGMNALFWPKGLTTPYGYGDIGVVEHWSDNSGIRLFYGVISILSFTATKNVFDASMDTGYTDISFKTDDVANINIFIRDSSDSTVRTLIEDITFPAGTSNDVCTWDGKDEEGRLVLPGEYTLRMTAQDGYGHHTSAEIPVTIKGTIIESYDISGEWEKENSPYVIYGTQAVRNIGFDDTLQINPGVRVMFWPHDEKYKVLVQGVIEARGVEEDSILISSYRKSWERENGDWGYIRTVWSRSKVVFKYSTIEFGGDTLQGTPAPVWIESSGADTVRHCTIRNSAGHGVYSGNDLCVIDSNTFSQNDSFPLVIGPPNGVGKAYENIFIDNGIQAINVKAGGTVSDDAIWTNQGVPYLISDFVEIKGSDWNACTLIIEPGDTLQFKNYGIRQIGYGTDKEGVLIAEGTKNEKITFCGVSDTSYWWAIRLRYGSVILKNCIIKNAGLGWGASIYIPGHGNDAEAIIDSCEIIRSKGHGVLARDNAEVQISNTKISECDSFPIVVEASEVKNIINNIYEDNAVEEICIRGEGHVKENAIWQNPGIPYRIQTDLKVYNNLTDTCTLTIEEGNILRFSQNTGLNIGSDYGYGMLNAQGTKDEPIIFTAVDSSEYWYQIYFAPQASDSSILRNCEISFAIKNIRCRGSSPRIDSCFIQNAEYTGISLWNCSPKITNSTISENTIGIDCGSYYDFSDPIIHNCNIVGNTEYGVKNNSTTYTIDADSCWWGSSTGPYDPSSGPPDYNPDGLGDKVSDYVDYRPWLQSGPYPLIVTGFVFTGDSVSLVVNPEVAITNLNTGTEWTATVAPDTNEYFLRLSGPGLPNVNDTLRITAKKTLDDCGTYDPYGYTYTLSITDRMVMQSDIDTMRIDLDIYLNHYCINYYPDYPYHTQNNWNYSGAAVMQMWTDFKDVEPPYS